MSWYRRTHEQLWTDKWVRTLKPERKLLWLYLLTGTQTNGIGLHTFKVAEAAEDLGFSKKKVLEALEDFAKIQRICWDRDSNLVWIPKWIRYNAPDGPNQVKFYEKAISAFLPHPFARALRILLVAACQDKQWAKRILTPHLALFIRDDLRCRYCQKVPERIDDLVVDTPNPDAGTSEKFDWERNVTACQSCVLRKTDGNSAGIGSGFVAGFHFSIAKATAKLIANAELRERVRKLCDGLPSEFADIEDIAGVAALGTGATNSGNGFGTLLEPFRIQETVNRKQEAGSSKQEAGKRGWENPRLASGDSAAPAPGDGDEERGKVTEIGPRILAEAYNQVFAIPCDRPQVQVPLVDRYYRAARLALKERPDPAYWAGVLDNMARDDACVNGNPKTKWKGADFEYLLRYHARYWGGAHARSA
jgi:hypothetical protein